MLELEMAGITSGRAPYLDRCSSVEADMRCLGGELITMREINSSFCVERAGIRSLLDNEMALDNRLNMTCHKSLENAGASYEGDIESNVKLQQPDNMRQIGSNKHKRKQESEHTQRVDDLDSHREVKMNEHCMLNTRGYRRPKQKQQSADSGIKPGESGKMQIAGASQPAHIKVNSTLQCEGIASRASSEEIETIRLKELRAGDTQCVLGTPRMFFCNSSEHGPPIENDKLAKLEEAFAKEKLENKKLRKEVEELKRQMTFLLDFVEQGKEICEHCQSIKQQMRNTLGSMNICNVHPPKPHVRGLGFPVSAQVLSIEGTGEQSPVGSCMSERETPKVQDPISDKDENKYYTNVQGKVKMFDERKSLLGRDLSADQGSNAECQLWVDLIPHTDDEDTRSPVGEMVNQNCYSIDEAHHLERDPEIQIVRMKKDHASPCGCPVRGASFEKVKETSVDQHVNEDSAVVRTLVHFGQTISEGSTLTPERNCQSQAPVNTVLRKNSTHWIQS